MALGERLNGTLVTRFSPQAIDERTLKARATAPAQPPATATVAVAEVAIQERTLPRTGSPLPLVGLLGAVFAPVALTLRRVRTRGVGPGERS